jgi:hypothetical protein
MNNKTIISIVVVIVAVLAGYWAVKVSDRNELTVQEPETVVEYNCEDGKSFEAGFSEGIVALSLDDGREMTLEYIRPDNYGHLYGNETGVAFFASLLSRIEEDGEVIYGNCMFEGEGFDRQVRGEIISIDSSEVPADGPYYIEIDLEETIERPETSATVMVPSMGINLCPARENMADVGTLLVGMTIEVNGYIGEGGYVRPCQSEGHYLRVISDEVVGSDIGNEGDGDSNGNGGEGERTACTQEAKLCPDGSYVGRTGPNCEFAPCPGE